MIKVLVVPTSDYLCHPFPQRHNQLFERLNAYDDFEVHVVRFNFLSKNRLKTTLKVHNLTGILSNSIALYYLLNSLSHALQIRRIVNEYRIDLIVLSNLACPFLYTLINQLSPTGIPIIVDLPDYFPTSATGNLFNVNSTHGKLCNNAFDYMLRKIMRHANLVTVVSNALKVYAEKANARWVEIVPNGIGENFLENKNSCEMKKKLGFSSQDFIIGYIGSIEFWLDIEPLFKGIELTIKEGIPVKLLLVGRGLHTNFSKKVSGILKDKLFANIVTWLDFVSYNEVPYYMSCINAGIIPFDISNPTSYYSSPNKMWEYLSQQIPVLSTAIPEAISNGCYLSIVNKPTDYVRVFSKLYLKDKSLFEKTQKGFIASREKTWAKSTERLAFLIRKIINSRTDKVLEMNNKN